MNSEQYGTKGFASRGHAWYNGGDILIAIGGTAQVPFNTVATTYDGLDELDLITNPNYVMVKHAGYYCITAGLDLSNGAATGYFDTYFRGLGPVAYAHKDHYYVTATNIQIQMSVQLYLTPTTLLGLWYNNATGGAIRILGGATPWWNFLTWHRLS